MFTVYAILATVCGLFLLTVSASFLTRRASMAYKPVLTVFNGIVFVGGFMLLIAALDWFNMIPEF